MRADAAELSYHCAPASRASACAVAEGVSHAPGQPGRTWPEATVRVWRSTVSRIALHPSANSGTLLSTDAPAMEAHDEALHVAVEHGIDVSGLYA